MLMTSARAPGMFASFCVLRSSDGIQVPNLHTDHMAADNVRRVNYWYRQVCARYVFALYPHVLFFVCASDAVAN